MSSSIFAFAALKKGTEVPLSVYKGRVTVIANTATLCSFSAANLAQLNEIQRCYGAKQCAVLAFPCAQFANQEPLSDAQLREWQTANDNAFTLFDRVKVKGPQAHPLFAYLQQQLGPVRWNFTKFICGRDGTPVARLDHTATLEQLKAAVDSLL